MGSSCRPRKGTAIRFAKQLQVVSSCLCCRHKQQSNGHDQCIAWRFYIRRQQRQQKTTFSCPRLVQVAVQEKALRFALRNNCKLFQVVYVVVININAMGVADDSPVVSNKTTTKTTKDNKRQQKTTFSCPRLYRLPSKKRHRDLLYETTEGCFKLSMLSS